MPAFVGRYRSLEDSESSVVASSADSSTRELGVFTVPKPAAACIRTSLGVLPKKGQRVNQGGLSASISMATRSCCITGHISEGTPTGEYIQIGGVEAYVAKPKEPSKEAIVISTDVFGHRLSNVQLIADAFAKDGFLTVVPDMFNGGGLPHWMLDALPKISGIPGDPAGPPSFFTRVTTILSLVPSLLWFNIRNRPATKVPILEAVIKEVKEKHGITKVGMIGYCYGGTPSFMIAKKEGVIDTFVVAHCQVSVPADIRTNKVAGLIIAAEADFAFPDKAREQAQEIIEKENLGENMRIKYFPGTFHGFAVRGDDKVELIKKAKEEAFYDASQWFKEHLK